MCLIVVKNDPKAHFDVEHFKNSFRCNSDGTGIMYIEEGRILVDKTQGPLQDHLDMYLKHKDREQFVLHHRKATHGEHTLLNVHPFPILSKDEGDAEDMWMVHNGVLRMTLFSKDCDKKLSDTHLFTKEYMTPLLRKYPDLLDMPQFQVMLHDLIGNNNKLTFLRSDGKVWIFNQDQGEEVNGCWLSNKYSIQPPYVAPVHNNTHYNRSNVSHRAHSHGSNTMNSVRTEVADKKVKYTDWNEYENHSTWWNAWNKANDNITKVDLMSDLDFDILIELINEYSSLSKLELEQKFINDRYAFYDMMNILRDTGVVEESFLDLVPTLAVEQIFPLLQRFGKQKAA